MTDAGVTVTQDTAAALTEADATEIVGEAARAAHQAVDSLAAAPDSVLDAALRTIAQRLGTAAAPVLAANEEDLRAAAAAGTSGALLDRLRLGEQRLKSMSEQLLALADAPCDPARRQIRDMPG